MSQPVLDLGNSANWSEVYSQFFYATPGAHPNSYNPIPALKIPFLFDRHILALATSSTKVKPHWYLAGRLIQQIDALGTDFVDVGTARVNIQLNVTQLVVLPKLSDTYKLRFEIPWWHEEMGLTIWEYTGPDSDTTQETLETIKVDIARLEFKLQNL